MWLSGKKKKRAPPPPPTSLPPLARSPAHRSGVKKHKRVCVSQTAARAARSCAIPPNRSCSPLSLAGGGGRILSGGTRRVAQVGSCRHESAAPALACSAKRVFLHHRRGTPRERGAGGWRAAWFWGGEGDRGEKGGGKKKKSSPAPRRRRQIEEKGKKESAQWKKKSYF